GRVLVVALRAERDDVLRSGERTEHRARRHGLQSDGDLSATAHGRDVLQGTAVLRRIGSEAGDLVVHGVEPVEERLDRDISELVGYERAHVDGIEIDVDPTRAGEDERLARDIEAAQ